MIPNYGLLLTDLYQLTMMQAYHQQQMHDIAVFEFFVRKMPANRNFFVSAGLEQALEFIEKSHFDNQELDWLSHCGRFEDSFLRSLENFRFSGDVYAMAEGTVFFPDEPILRVVAPIAEGQILESRIINLLHYQTLVASKAARCRLAAPEKLLVDFGMRRAHGGEAGLLAARASYLAGFAGSSTVMAGQYFSLPIYGTMAHSFVQAHDTENLAFEHFANAQVDNVVLLIDTYDTEAGAAKVVEVAKKLEKKNISVRAVRLDSGDLVEHALKVRKILNAGGLTAVKIFASGNLDEYRLQELINVGAPIDGFGVGTALVTSADSPYLDCAYKLQEYAGVAKRKCSEGKATWPGRKQVFRSIQNGEMTGDLIALESESAPGIPLLTPVIKAGNRCAEQYSLEQIREYTMDQLTLLPDTLKQLETSPPYPTIISDNLRQLADQVDANRY